MKQLSYLKEPIGCSLQTTADAIKKSPRKGLTTFPKTAITYDNKKMIHGWVYEENGDMVGMNKIFPKDENILGDLLFKELEENSIFLHDDIPHQIISDEDFGLKIMQIDEVRNSLEAAKIISNCYLIGNFCVIPYLISEGEKSLIAWYCTCVDENNEEYVVIPFFIDDLPIYKSMNEKEATVKFVEPGTPFHRANKSYIMDSNGDGTFFYYEI